MKKTILISLASLFAASLFAEIKMPAIFGDNMMFQQQKPINIWGTAKPNAQVKAMFNFKYTQAKADKDGNWKMALPAEAASFSPKALVMFEDNIPSLTIKNILVGEVWLAGGQSNMEWRVAKTTDRDLAVKNAAKLKGKMRYFKQSSDGYSKVEKNEFQKGAKWIMVDEKNVDGTTAVGYYFAERLLADLKVPVGIIYASKGASTMAAWTDKQTLLNGWCKDYAPIAGIIKRLETYTDAEYKQLLAAHNKKVADFDARVAKAKAEGKKPPVPSWDFRLSPSIESPIVDYKTPTLHFNGKIAPMRNFVFRGVIWYQGESDSNPGLLEHYTESFGMLIDCWRKRLGNPDLPFLQVQLASYDNIPREWCLARQAQFENTKKFKNVYMACIIDTGEENNIHPHDKTTPGARLEKIALQKIYGFNAVSDAPEFKSAEFDGGAAKVFFNDFGAGLCFKGEPRGFEVLVDGKWQPAKAALENGAVVVKSSDGKQIAGVRYLWHNWISPDACLFNKQGLPAIPFEKLK